MTRNWREIVLDPIDRAIAAHAEKLTIRPADVTPEDLDTLRSFGLSDLALLDLTLVIAYFNFVNRIASGLHVELEGHEGSAAT